MRCSNCGKKVAEVVAVARPAIITSPKSVLFTERNTP
jgi:hypothetical protein